MRRNEIDVTEAITHLNKAMKEIDKATGKILVAYTGRSQEEIVRNWRAADTIQKHATEIEHKLGIQSLVIRNITETLHNYMHVAKASFGEFTDQDANYAVHLHKGDLDTITDAIITQHRKLAREANGDGHDKPLPLIEFTQKFIDLVEKAEANTPTAKPQRILIDPKHWQIIIAIKNTLKLAIDSISDSDSTEDSHMAESHKNIVQSILTKAIVAILDEKVDGNSDDPTDISYNIALDHAIAAIRKLMQTERSNG